MSTIKRRKVDSSTTRPGPTTRGIAAFTKVSKAQVISKTVYDKNLAATTSIDTIDLSVKRKLQPVEEETVDAAAEQASELLNSSTKTTERVLRPLPQRRTISSQALLKTPQRPIAPAASPTPTPGSIQTPTNGARTLLDRFLIQSSPSSSPSSPTFDNAELNLDSSQTTIPSQSAPSPSPEDLPTELLDLINLHSSFLTALTLHYAHNGTHTPADLRLLCPNVARAWGKRRVLSDDIRRTLAVLNLPSSSASQTTANLSLSDYGHGKLCIEIRTSGRTGRIAKPLDENTMNATFSSNLSDLWREATAQLEVQAFVAALPLEPITTCSSVAKMSPLLAKGQRRLEDMRAGITIRKAADEAKLSAAKQLDDAGRRPTLLERLRAKAAERAHAPAGPSTAELARTAALGRLAEVVAVVTLLTTGGSVGQSRVSFTLPTVLGRLRDSFRTPMSRGEGEDCVRLLAAEIAPEWLKFAKMGRTEAVVVSRECRPSDAVIRERIEKAGRA